MEIDANEIKANYRFVLPLKGTVTSRYVRREATEIVSANHAGIDIGAKEDIYRIIRELAQQGTTVLLVSSEMQELIRLSDRVIVMREGKVQGILDKAELSQDGIMHYAMGAHELKQ